MLIIKYDFITVFELVLGNILQVKRLVINTPLTKGCPGAELFFLLLCDCKQALGEGRDRAT